MEAKCPRCGVVIYLGFVKINGYCPACNKPLLVEDTVEGPALCLPEQVSVASLSGVRLRPEAAREL
jgi:uncharacterized protein (DUF983 family)